MVIQQGLTHAAKSSILRNRFVRIRFHISSDGKFVDSPSGRIVNPGHSLEAAWFILPEDILGKNEEAIAAGKKIIDITLPLGFDKNHGGIIAFCDINGQPPVQLEWDMKLWWPQCEAMIALRLAYLLFGEDEYRLKYEELKAYCKKYFMDPQHGEWYGYLHYDNTVSTKLKGNIFKGPFHVPRIYIIMSVLDEDGCVKRYAKYLQCFIQKRKWPIEPLPCTYL